MHSAVLELSETISTMQTKYKDKSPSRLILSHSAKSRNFERGKDDVVKSEKVYNKKESDRGSGYQR